MGRLMRCLQLIAGPVLCEVKYIVGCPKCWHCGDKNAIYTHMWLEQGVEDHDDLTPLFTSQNDTLIDTYGEYVLAELIEAQDDENVAVVCEDEGKAVGFMSVCSEVNTQLLHDCFDLGPFHGLCKPHPDDVLQLPPEPDNTAEVSSIPRRESTDTQDTETQGIKAESCRTETSECTISVPPSVVESELSKEAEAEPVLSLPSLEQLLDTAHEEALKPSEAPSVEREAFHPIYRGAVNAFCIQLFCIDERYETRSLDFLNFVFKLFPDRDFCIITVPHMVPEFYLIQNFVRVIPFSICTLDQELYVFHRSGLLKSFIVRPAKSNDILAVEVLIKTLDLNRSMLDDLNNYTLARRDLDGTPVQAFVAEVLKQIVGIAIIRNEMDVEYIRSHYNVEDFIYFNHHQREDHGHLYHFALNPIFHHYAKHFMKEILRRSYKTCLYYPIHPQTAKGKVTYTGK
uniref:Uncharacterized protein n=1 Tax=Sphaerodactylus townsendi TaxID=933632 RepID=A0ACB8EBX6_9SAUR